MACGGCGGGRALTRAVFGAHKTSSGTPRQPVLASQVRSQKLASLIENQTRQITLERREIQRKRDLAILKNMQKLQ